MPQQIPRAQRLSGDCCDEELFQRYVRKQGRLMPDNRGTARTLAAANTLRYPIRVVTYNIHACVGVDRRYDPARIAAVLHQIDADIACLQEVDVRRGTKLQADQAAYLAESTGCQVILGAGPRGHCGRFANAILTRFPVAEARAIDLAVSHYEPRAALDAELIIGDRVLRVLATHFGLHAGERRLQANRLIAALDEPSAPGKRAERAVLLVGDLNEWRGRSGGIRALDRCLGPSAARPTFPSWMPVLPLDRIYADGLAVLRDVHVYHSPLARLASDHLPLVGSLWWTDDQAQRGDQGRILKWRAKSGLAASAHD
jgi:endonuclease/exonuclease/phosphatase family metal-dependent hydrolase